MVIQKNKVDKTNNDMKQKEERKSERKKHQLQILQNDIKPKKIQMHKKSHDN